MVMSFGRGRAAVGLAALVVFAVSTHAYADSVPLPPDLKSVKRAYAKTQALQAQTQTSEDAAPEMASNALEPSNPQKDTMRLLARVPLPPARPKLLDAVDVASQTTEVVQTKAPAGRADIHALVNEYAALHGVPERLAHRVVLRESRYNPLAKGGPHYGLMQISLPTARQMGFSGPANGLFDARTNLAHAMPYLANAWLVSGGNETRAVQLYSRGFYYDAKRQGMLKQLRTARSAPLETLAVADAEPTRVSD